MNKPYITRITRISIMPEDGPIFAEQCTHVEIDDEGAGELVIVRQQSARVDVKPQSIQIEPDEWPAMCEAIETLFADIKNHEKDTRKPL